MYPLSEVKCSSLCLPRLGFKQNIFKFFTIEPVYNDLGCSPYKLHIGFKCPESRVSEASNPIKNEELHILL